jgi:hypothetical protein
MYKDDWNYEFISEEGQDKISKEETLSLFRKHVGCEINSKDLAIRQTMIDNRSRK